MARARTDDLVGMTLDGRYRVREHLADGGMASVYLGTDLRLDRDVAIKVMRPDLAADESFVSRFRREARSAARLSHPNVVAVHDQGETDGLVFLVMEHVPGQTLREVLSTEGALTPRAALDILEPVLAGLAAAHRAGLIHRDIKPENVIIREDGTIKVADFGLARAVSSQTATGATGVLLGTVSYLSPEQVERGIADPRSDVYAAGLVLFEMLTGSKAIDGETPIHVAFQHVHGDLPRLGERSPDLPDALDDLVDPAIARDPDERPRDADAYLGLVHDVRDRLTDDELDHRPEPQSERGLATAAAATVAHRNAPTRTTSRASDGPPSPPPTQQVVATGASSAHPTGRRRRSPLVWLLPLVILLGAAGGAYWWTTVGSMTSVPSVSGKSADAIQGELDAAGLTMARKEAFDEDVPKGTAMRSTPAAGTEVRRGSDVTVTFSKGPERHAVPALASITERSAEGRLRKAHLTKGSVSESFSETVEKGRVISSSPDEGASLRRDAKVDLVVSKGREPIPLPSVTGRAYASARSTLEEAGFTVKRGTDVNSTTVAKGSVVSQDPSSDTAHRGDTVTLVVSKGPVMVAVPDVNGMTEAEATSKLEAAGFTVEVNRVFGGVLDNVRAVDPRIGSRAAKGSTVKIYVV